MNSIVISTGRRLPVISTRNRVPAPIGYDEIFSERVFQLHKLGTRAVVATALAAKAEQVHQAVQLLCDSAAAGDLKSAQALILG